MISSSRYGARSSAMIWPKLISAEPVGRPVVVGQVEVRDPEVERAAQRSRAGFPGRCRRRSCARARATRREASARSGQPADRATIHSGPQQGCRSCRAVLRISAPRAAARAESRPHPGWTAPARYETGCTSGPLHDSRRAGCRSRAVTSTFHRRPSTWTTPTRHDRSSAGSTVSMSSSFNPSRPAASRTATSATWPGPSNVLRPRYPARTS